MKTFSSTILYLLIICILCENEVGCTPDDELTYDSHHRIQMGVSNVKCDDAKTMLEVDWDDNPVNYTCFTPKKRLPVKLRRVARLECENIPSDYVPDHHCMNERLEYDTPLPTHAPHRPLWAVFGEYVFIPPQRWSHNIEHGSVVMLYHPCTYPHLVQELKSIVKGCIRKHVIAASNMVSEKYPLVLIAWGCRYQMAMVDGKMVKKFIKTYGRKGPEGHYSKEGQYTHMLLERAKVPKGSTLDDSVLCPRSR